MLRGLRPPPRPPAGGLFISYSSSKPGGGKSPAGYGLRGSAARGSLKGLGWAAGGNLSSRKGSRAGDGFPPRSGGGFLDAGSGDGDVVLVLAACALSSYPSFLNPGAHFWIILPLTINAKSAILPALMKQAANPFAFV